jgi:hypothetical protein
MQHDRKMKSYEAAKDAALRAANFERDLAAAEKKAAASGKFGLDR